MVISIALTVDLVITADLFDITHRFHDKGFDLLRRVYKSLSLVRDFWVNCLKIYLLHKTVNNSGLNICDLRQRISKIMGLSCVRAK